MSSAPDAQIVAALTVLRSMGLKPEDLLGARDNRPPVPTFAQWVPQVYAAMPDTTTRDGYMSYWRHLVRCWPDRRIDEPTLTEFKQLIETIKAQRNVRRSDRNGTGMTQTIVSALRCLYHFAIADKIIAPADNPVLALAKPPVQESNRRALSNQQLHAINTATASTTSDPELYLLILRLHTETACRRGGALNLRRSDLDEEQCLILLKEKGGLERWQPVSPTLMAALVRHYEQRCPALDHQHSWATNGRPISAEAHQRLLRYSNGNPISKAVYDRFWIHLGKHLPWIASRRVTIHWLRHTTLRWVDRNFGASVAKAYAGHTDRRGGATAIYTRAHIEEVAAALAALTGEPHPLMSSSIPVETDADPIPFLAKEKLA
ncbi:tyrosine-type recombinase/integrase [Nocardia sp. CA-128927]|uniref:tyrosine-type recombinase/integrase n=1 Tax=Nocardia sp. CA-128927 TaxID=3239975 RepID=UPI003D98B125